ncbi:MAG: hypothetical protein LBD04_08875 [Synergistaceae bacterium]|nr:hypothetical protein [Synergistaceae bacterium]
MKGQQLATRAIGSFPRKIFAVYIRFLVSYFRAPRVIMKNAIVFLFLGASLGLPLFLDLVMLDVLSLRWYNVENQFFGAGALSFGIPNGSGKR